MDFKRQLANGFTLIELLVAITILSIVAVMGWRGLDSIVHTRTVLTQSMEQTRGIQIAFAQLESDCAHAIDPQWFPQHDVIRTADSRFIMVRSVYDDQQPVRLQVVVYRVDEGVLTRRESPATRDLQELDAFWQSALGGTDIFIPVALVPNVTSIALTTFPQTAGPIANYTGIQVDLQIREQSSPLSKVFILGSS